MTNDEIFEFKEMLFKRFNNEDVRFTRVLANSFEFVESKNTVNNQSNKNDYDETEDDEDFPF